MNSQGASERVGLNTRGARGPAKLACLMCIGLLGCKGDASADTSDTMCPVGAERCPCGAGGACDPGLICASDVCVDPGNAETESTTESTAGPTCDLVTGCISGGICSELRPNVTFYLDYSSSTTLPLGSTTRWEAVRAGVTNARDAMGRSLGDTMNIAVIRFGHDPDTSTVGTTLPVDVSSPPLIDGVASDLHWFDSQGGDSEYVECAGAGQSNAVASEAIPPMTGIGSWTKGALDYGATLITESRAVHQEAIGERRYVNIVITDGGWNSPNGVESEQFDNPAITAKRLFDDEAIVTYVVDFGFDVNAVFADELAFVGGSGSSISVTSPAELQAGIEQVVALIQAEP